MIHLLKLIFDWSTQPAVMAVLLGLSVTSFVVSIIGVPWYLKRLPSDYFTRPESAKLDDARLVGPLLGVVFVVLKNAVGGLLVLAGIAMLVLPGQGIATLLVGLLMMDFPKKKLLERRVLALGPVLRAVNGLRQRAGKPALLVPETDPPTHDTHPPHSQPSSAR